MKIRTYLIELLRAIEAAVPPPENCHHCITYAKHGNDADGWSEKLALQVNRGGKFYCFFLEEDDLPYDSANIQRVAEEIVEQLKLPETSFQIGVSQGQYR
jgi:hypothetical protein